MRILLFLLVCFSIIVVAQGNNDIVVKKNRNMQQLSVDGEVLRTTEANIVEPKLIPVTRSTRVATWVEESDDKRVHFFAIKTGETWKPAKKTSYDILLREQTFDPLTAVRTEVMIQSRPGSRLYLLQFVTQGLDEYKETLRGMGVEIHQYVANHSHVVRMNEELVPQVKKLAFVRWVGAFHPSYKLEQNLIAEPHRSGEYNIVLVDVEDKDELQAQIAALGGKVINPVEGSLLLSAQLSPEQVQEVSHSEYVLWIEKATEIEVDIDMARIQGGANFIESKLEGYTGRGIRGHVMEGIYRDHPDFAANDVRQAPVVVDDGSPDGHGQNTYGEVFGDGKNNPRARGMLPEAQGFYTHYNAVYNNSPENEGKGSRFELVGRLKKEHQVMFQTASWGYERTKEYTARSVEMDHLIFVHDLAITQSQSNAGTRDSRPQAWAKNIISVGAVYHFNNVNLEDDKWNRGASIGPAGDGRIKPDLCGYYDATLTTDGAKGYTEHFGGTSGATPMVAGHLGLFLQMWTDGIFGNQLKAPKGDRFANLPHFTTSKAMLICTAKQYSFEGAAHDRTRVHQGWGFPDLKELMEQRHKIFVVNEEHVLKNLESKTYTINVASGEPELKVTLVYADPPATVNSTQQRINNLDLKVTAPDGTVYWGNNGLLENLYSTAGGEANTVDTVENVFVAKPTAGMWKVEVIADEVNADSHKETSETDVDYALVVKGITH